MSVEQMDELRSRHRIERGAEWERFAGLALPPAVLEEYIAGVPFAEAGSRRYEVPAVAVPEAVCGTEGGAALHPGVLREDPRLHRAGAERVRRPGRDHVAGRDRLHQSRRLGQPTRRVLRPRAGRYLPRGGGRLFPGVGRLAAGDSTSSSASRRTTSSFCSGCSGSRIPSSGSGCCRLAPSTTPSSSAGWMRSATPATRMHDSCSWPPRRGSASPRRRGPSVDLDPAHRHGPGPAGRLRTGIRRRACGHHALGIRLHAARANGAGAAARPGPPRRRSRRVGLSAAEHEGCRAARSGAERRRRGRDPPRRILADPTRAGVGPRHRLCGRRRGRGPRRPPRRSGRSFRAPACLRSPPPTGSPPGGGRRSAPVVKEAATPVPSSNGSWRRFTRGRTS